jgi:DNA-binding MarR family transcriptional regulator
MTRPKIPTRRAPGKLADRDYAALATFRGALRAFLAFSEQAARGAGLTPQQHQAILMIRGLASQSAATVNALADQLQLKPQTAVGLVDRLEKAGLVRRQRDAEDRRRVFIHLTPKSEAVLESLSRAHLAQVRRDAPQLMKLLEQMSKHGRR